MKSKWTDPHPPQLRAQAVRHDRQQPYTFPTAGCPQASRAAGHVLTRKYRVPRAPPTDPSQAFVRAQNIHRLHFLHPSSIVPRALSAMGSASKRIGPHARNCDRQARSKSAWLGLGTCHIRRHAAAVADCAPSCMPVRNAHITLSDRLVMEKERAF